MELDMRDIDLYISKILTDFNNKYKLAMYVILIQCIKEIGLNKKSIIENLESFKNDEKLIKLGKSSFTNKTYLKNFINLEKNSRDKIIKELIGIIEKCEEKASLLVIPKQPKLVSKPESSTEQKKTEIIEFEDSEIGNIKIDISCGTICCENIKYHSNGKYNDFPVYFDLGEIKIFDKEDINLVADFEMYKDIYLNDIKKILENMKVIEKFVINEVWKWFAVDYTDQEIRERFVGMNTTLNINLMSEKKNDISMVALWGFEIGPDNDDMGGYFDICINKENEKVEGYDIGFW